MKPLKWKRLKEDTWQFVVIKSELSLYIYYKSNFIYIKKKKNFIISLVCL